MKNYFLVLTLATAFSVTAQHKTLPGFDYGNPAAPTGDEGQSPENLSLNHPIGMSMVSKKMAHSNTVCLSM